MSTYLLTGAGVQPLTSGTTKLFALVTITAPTATVGQAHPDNWFGLGLLRFGEGGWYMPAFPIDAVQMIISVPSGATDIGYSLINGSTLTLSENTAPPPLGTSVSTDHDSSGFTTTDTVIITFARSDTPGPNDYIGIFDSGWGVSFGNAFGYWVGSAAGCTAIGGCGGTPNASGTQSGAAQNPFSYTTPTTVWARYVDGATNTLIASSGPITFTP